jgi:hypothetical protein
MFIKSSRGLPITCHQERTHSHQGVVATLWICIREEPSNQTGVSEMYLSFLQESFRPVYEHEHWPVLCV